MYSLTILQKALAALNLQWKQDGDYVRLYCPLSHDKPPSITPATSPARPSRPSRPSASINIKNGAYHCFSCRHHSPDLFHFLQELEFQERYILKKSFLNTLRAIEIVSEPTVSTTVKNASNVD